MNETQARRVVSERAGGRCELCSGTDRLTFAHRLNRSHGGGWTPSNGLRLCWPCHDWTERNPEKAYAGGWRIRWPGPEPAAAPVWLEIWGGAWPGWFLLADDGTYRPVHVGKPGPELRPWYPADQQRGVAP